MKKLMATLTVALCALAGFGDEITYGEKVTTEVDGKIVRLIKAGQTIGCIGTGPSLPEGNINKHNNETTGPYAGSKCAILMEDGATLCVTNSGNSIWPAIIVTNGTATVRHTGVADVLVFNDAIILRNGAELHVTGPGIGCISVGNNTSKPVLELKGLKVFSDSQGVENATGKVQYRYHSRIRSLPENWARTSNAEQSAIYFIGDAFTGVTEIANLPKITDFYFQSPDYVSGKTITLDYASAVHLSPFGMGNNPQTLGEIIDAYEKACTINTNVTGAAYSCNVALNDAGGALVIDCGDNTATPPVYSTFEGNISGSGTVRVNFASDKPTLAAPAGTTLTVTGDASAFTGTLETRYTSRTGELDGYYGYLTLPAALPNATLDIGLRTGVIAAPTEDTTISVASATGVNATSYIGAEAGKTLTVGEASGTLQTFGDGTVSFTSYAPATTIIGTGATPPTACLKALDVTGTCVAFCTSNADGKTVDVGAFIAAIGSSRYRTLQVSEGLTLANYDSKAALNAASNPTLAADTETVRVYGNGTVTFQNGGYDPEAWTNRVAYWFDFSKTNTLSRASYYKWSTDDLLNAKREYESRQCPIFERCVDWRQPEAEWSLWNGVRYCAEGGYVHAAKHQYPILATNLYAHKEGVSYMTFGEYTSGRLPFNRGFNSSSGNPNIGEDLAVQYVVMVYSSRCGGGMSLIANAKDLFARTADKNSPYMNSAPPTGVELRTGGDVIADPTASHPNGDWEVLTIKMNGESFRGLGFSKSSLTSGNGYSEYGEVLLFTNALTATERRQAEYYLAQKWNLAYSATELAALQAAKQTETQAFIDAQTNAVIGVGNSAARVETTYATLNVAGCYTGTIAAHQSRVVIDAQLPWTAEQMPTEGLEFWIDPEDPTLTTLGGNQGDQAYYISDKGGKTDRYFTSNSTRAPYLRSAARGFGPERKWLEFRVPSGTVNKGRNMRTMTQRTDPMAAGNPAATFNIRSAFMAMDSCYGGGDPLLDDITGGSIIKTRWNNTSKTKYAYYDPIWAEKTGDAYKKNAVSRLNGEVVDESKGFTGTSEVFSFKWASTLNGQWYLDNYTATESAKNSDSLVLGESLYYSTELTDTQTLGIESYLMSKWTGCVPSGFGDARQATITGSGEIEVADATRMPQIAGDFAGTIAVGGETGAFTMTVDPTTEDVTGRLAFDAATVTLPSEVTLTVSMTETPAKSVSERRYLLARASGVTQWNLTKGANVPAKAYLDTDGDEVYLVLPPTGLIIQFR